MHGAYLVNLASEGELYKKSIDNLSTHLQIAVALGADGLIFHIGASKEKDIEKVHSRIAKGVKEVLGKVKGEAKLIMENSSGGGGKIGSTLEELAALHKKLDFKRVAFCLDTAHVFASGYDLRAPKNVKETLKKFDTTIGLERLKMSHCNDSKVALGSHVDRHENIGQGDLGLNAFKAIIAEPKFKTVNLILETPRDEKGTEIRSEIKMLKSLRNQ